MPKTLNTVDIKVKDPSTGNFIPITLLNSDTLSSIDDAKDAAITAVTAAGTAAQANFPATAAACDTLAGDFAPTYDPTATYNVGDYCTYQYQLYICKTAITTAQATFDASYWTQIALSNEVDDVKTQIDNYIHILGNDSNEITLTGMISIANVVINTTGGDGESTISTSSPFIPVYKNGIIEYAGLAHGTNIGLLTFYDTDYECVTDVTVAGKGASTAVSGTFYVPYDGFIRLCTRTDKLSNAAVTYKPYLYNKIHALDILNTEIVGLLDDSRGRIINTGEQDNSSGYLCSTYIFIAKGWAINYSGMRLPTTANVISYYSSMSASDYVSGVAGQGATNPVQGSFTAPADGFIRLCSRADSINGVSIIMTNNKQLTKYVSPSGNDNNDGNNPESAYATIAKAISESATTIYLDSGTYVESVIINTPINLRIVGNNSVFTVNSYAFAFSGNGSHIEIENVTANLSTCESTSTSAFFIKNGYAKFVNCKAFYAPYMGFRLDGSKCTLIGCVADHAGVDGFNAHDTTNNISESVFFNCIATNCGDDGLSFHEEGKIHVIGGEYAYNNSTGIAPHNNCNCDINSAYIHENGRAGIEALVGNYSAGIPDPLPTMVLSNCILENNSGNAVTAEHYTVKANANGANGNGVDSIVNSEGSTITIFTALT